jgi:hypothetical protein
MLYLVAISTAGLPKVVRARVEPGRRSPVTIGGGPEDDVTLDGLPCAVASLARSGSRWKVSLDTGLRDEIADGSTVSFGGWCVWLFADEQPGDLLGGELDGRALAEVLSNSALDEGPSLEFPGGRLHLDGQRPLVVGNVAGSDLRLAGEPTGCAVAVRRHASGGTFLYPLNSAGVRRNGQRVTRRARLSDGDGVELAPGASSTLRFRDPEETLDRLLGEIRSGTATDRVQAARAAAPDSRSAVRRTLERVGASVSAWEAGLWAAGASVAAAYAALVLARC